MLHRTRLARARSLYDFNTFRCLRGARCRVAIHPLLVFSLFFTSPLAFFTALQYDPLLLQQGDGGGYL
jgi:hypothetical protein